MKILVLTPGIFDKGGISRYMRFQIEALRSHYGNPSIKILSLLGRRLGDLEEPFDVDWCGAVPVTRASRVHFASVATYVASTWRPHMVLCGLLNLGPVAFAAAQIARAQLIANLYGYEVWSERGRLRLLSLRRADRAIADCNNTADRALTLGLVQTRPTVVWDCVDLVRYTPGQAEPGVLARYGVMPSPRFRVTFLGRLQASARYKGADRLIHLVSQMPSERFEAVIAGQGDDLGYLRKLAEQVGVVDRVAFTGGINERDLPDLLRASDAFYLVSTVGNRKGEGLPLTPIEALACGVPVLVSDKDGSREILDGRGGFCGDPDDVEGQAAYLHRLADDSTFHAAERSAARLRAEQAFSYPAFAKATVSCFVR